MKIWKPDFTWEDFAVAIIGGGESLSLSQIRALGMARAENLIRVIAVNDSIFPAWFADIGYAADAAWWNYHGPLNHFRGFKLTLDNHECGDIWHVRNGGPQGYDPRPEYVRSGGNGAYQCIQIAAKLAVKEILLVGIDMRGGHWFGQHPLAIRKNDPKWPMRLSDFAILDKELSKIGVTVKNCSPSSALNCFQNAGLINELNLLRERRRLCSTLK